MCQERQIDLFIWMSTNISGTKLVPLKRSVFGWLKPIPIASHGCMPKDLFRIIGYGFSEHTQMGFKGGKQKQRYSHNTDKNTNHHLSQVQAGQSKDKAIISGTSM